MNPCAEHLLCLFDRATQAWWQAPGLQGNALFQGLAGVGNWWGGDGVIYCGVLFLIGARLMQRRSAAIVALRALESLTVASAISGIIKGFAGRARPFVTPGEPWQFDFAHGWRDAHFFSMPSGHTTATFAFAVAVCVVTTGWPRATRALVGGTLLLSALIVAASRMFADQHWGTDVIMAALIGSVSGWAVARWHLRRGDTGFDRVLAGRRSPT